MFPVVGSACLMASWIVLVIHGFCLGNDLTVGLVQLLLFPPPFFLPEHITTNTSMFCSKKEEFSDTFREIFAEETVHLKVTLIIF